MLCQFSFFVFNVANLVIDNEEKQIKKCASLKLSKGLEGFNLTGYNLIAIPEFIFS